MDNTEAPPNLPKGRLKLALTDKIICFPTAKVIPSLSFGRLVDLIQKYFTPF